MVLIKRAVEFDFVIPMFQGFKSRIERIFEECKANTTGTVSLVQYLIGRRSQDSSPLLCSPTVFTQLQFLNFTLHFESRTLGLVLKAVVYERKIKIYWKVF